MVSRFPDSPDSPSRTSNFNSLRPRVCSDYFSLEDQSRSQYVHHFCDGVTTLINHISITNMSTLMKVGAIDRAPSVLGARLLVENVICDL